MAERKGWGVGERWGLKLPSVPPPQINTVPNGISSKTIEILK